MNKIIFFVYIKVNDLKISTLTKETDDFKILNKINTEFSKDFWQKLLCSRSKSKYFIEITWIILNCFAN